MISLYSRNLSFHLPDKEPDARNQSDVRLPFAMANQINNKPAHVRHTPDVMTNRGHLLVSIIFLIQGSVELITVKQRTDKLEEYRKFNIDFINKSSYITLYFDKSITIK